MNKYLPEGYVKRENYEYTIEDLKSAIQSKRILEGIVNKSDSNLSLHLNLGEINGIIKVEDFELNNGHKGLNKNRVNCLVGKVVVFRVLKLEENADGTILAILSRREAQEEFKRNIIDKRGKGAILPSRVLRIEKYGLFCDIGCGVKGLLPIKNFCINRLTDLEKELECRDIFTVIDNIGTDGKIVLSHKELLGTWKEEASKFNVGDHVIGTVRSVESYGVFIELTPNLSGLAKVSNDLKYGDRVVVEVKSIRHKQLKVVVKVISLLDHESSKYTEFDYRFNGENIRKWRYEE